MATLGDLANKVKRLVREDASQLDPGQNDTDDYYDAIEAALMAYSRQRPFVVAADKASDSHGDVLTSDIDDFDESFLNDLQIEYPISTGGQPAYIDKSRWTTFVIPDDGRVLRVYGAASVTLRFRHRVMHALPFDDSGDPDPDGNLTVPSFDVVALSWKAAAIALQMMANFYANSADKATGADFVAFTTKSNQYEARGKTLARWFDEHMAGAQFSERPKRDVRRA